MIEYVVRIEKMTMLAVMLAKLSRLYPEYAYTCTWERAHILLAEFCLPEEYRHKLIDGYDDRYYHNLVSMHLGIPISEVTAGFHRASESEKSKSQLS